MFTVFDPVVLQFVGKTLLKFQERRAVNYIFVCLRRYGSQIDARYIRTSVIRKRRTGFWIIDDLSLLNMHPGYSFLRHPCGFLMDMLSLTYCRRTVVARASP